MRNKFDEQLRLLEEMLTRMGELCELAIAKATKALQQGDAQAAKEIITADEEIDQLEKDIERLCLKLLLQQQPVAKDLRRISAALKMITDMERIGDQTADIAEIIITSNISSELVDVDEIGKMAAAASKMVRDSVSAYVEKNLELATEVQASDDAVDQMFDEIKATLIQKIADNQGQDGSVGIDLIMITKYLERIGDHATNIAEWVEFSITGIHKDAQI